MKRLLYVLLLIQLVFDLFVIGRITGIESYLANDWKGSDICDRVNQLEDNVDDLNWLFNERGQ